MITSRIARPRYLFAAAALAVSAAVTGCSGSSSDGEPASMSTARADASATFHNVTPRANRILQRTLPLMRGVASNTYQGTDLVVTFRPTALEIDQDNVENVVRQAKQKAATKSDGKKSKKD